MDKTWEVYLYRPVALLLFHPFVSFLFLYSWEKKDTRIVCQPTRKAPKTVIRSISCSLQLRLKSNESKKMVIKRWNGRSDIVIFLAQVSVIFIQENAAFIQVLIYQAWHNQLLNTINE